MMKVVFNITITGASLVMSIGCGSSTVGSSPSKTQTRSSSEPQQTLRVDISAVDTTFVTRDHFIASVEMQISGEPFAQAMGRDLAGYSRDVVCQLSVCTPGTYYDPALNGGVAGGPVGRTDIAGYSTAVESYEYSKQPMNNIAFESGAGTSLAFGPVLNATLATGADAVAVLRTWVQKVAVEANTTARTVSAAVTPNNPLGWPGFWPTLQPFAAWNPTIAPSDASTGCSISSDDDPGASGALQCDDYECDYTSLHLPNRTTQVTPLISPGASGWAGWKEALWTLNYLQVMHDAGETAVNTVPSEQLGRVGAAGNTVLGNGGASVSTVSGTFLGSSDIEGFQAANFIQILDNQAEQWLTALTTTDGNTLGGFGAMGDALGYSDVSSLRWFPHAIAVTEASDASGFPRPSSYAIASPTAAGAGIAAGGGSPDEASPGDSDLLDLAGLVGAYASIYALTDQSNVQAGGSQAALAYFDGDPFPVQNQTPTGAPTLHDRALAMLRVALVDMERLHFNAATGLFADDVTFVHGQPAMGSTLSADVAAYALLSLRTARRALDSVLVLYGNTTPDIEGAPTLLDSFPQVAGQSFGALLDNLIRSLSGIFYDKLTAESGVAYAGWDLARGAAIDTGTSLDAHTAAIRGLLVAYLATGQTKYRDRALSVFERLESAFYDPSGRIYRTTAGDTTNSVVFTPRRFGLLQAALRDTYELIALLPGHAPLAALIESRVGRLNKLVLNGWDDRDQDETIEWPDECAHKTDAGPDGKPLGLGGLQMAERVLSGDSGSVSDTIGPDAGPRVRATDREHDCVPEISAAGLPSALANSVTFTLSPNTSP
jgi:hypothetical protein